MMCTGRFWNTQGGIHLYIVAIAMCQDDTVVCLFNLYLKS